MNEHDIAALPAGSTIILATTSPDKKQEYEEIFARYDVNFFTLEDFGLSPQKTDEMTGSYNDNLLEKAHALSQTLHVHYDAIKNVLEKRGVYQKGELNLSNSNAPKIVGMVEDSGIEVYPELKDEELRAKFQKIFLEKLEQKVIDDFAPETALHDQAFSGEDNEEMTSVQFDFLKNDTEWLFKIEDGRMIPGPNFKPHLEHLQGGFVEWIDTIYDAMADTHVEAGDYYKTADIEASRVMRYRNHSSSVIVEPSAHPDIDTSHIVEGENKGYFISREEFDAFIERFRNPELSDTPAHYKTGQIHTPHIMIPNSPTGREDEMREQGKGKTRQYLIDHEKLLQSEHNQLAKDYRLQLAERLESHYGIPRITENGVDNARWENPDDLNIMILHDGENSHTAKALKERLQSGTNLSIIDMPSFKTLEHDPDARLMDGADVVFVMPGDDGKGMDNSRLLLAATVDKQTMPYAKGKSIIVLNPKDDQDKGYYDNALSLIRMSHVQGLKNGLSEVNEIIEYDPNDEKYSYADDAKSLYADIKHIIARESERKSRRLTDIDPIAQQNEKANPDITSIPDDQFTVFVAGGAANDYPLFKEPAKQLGRFIAEQGYVLVTGAGQKEGPMGAVHSGFVDQYLEDKLSDTRVAAKIISARDNFIENAGLSGQSKNQFAERIKSALDATTHNGFGRDRPPTRVNSEALATEAPELLDKLLNSPNNGLKKALAGSLLEEQRMWGYTMPPLQISEGSGKPPPGMVTQNTGNFQRRMHEMTKAAAHVYLSGGQGTQQELIESVRLNAYELLEGEGSMKDIIILNQPAYGGGKVFDLALENIDAYLDTIGKNREEIGLKVVENTRQVQDALQEAKSSWQDHVSSIRPNTDIQLAI